MWGGTWGRSPFRRRQASFLWPVDAPSANRGVCRKSVSVRIASLKYRIFLEAVLSVLISPAQGDDARFPYPNKKVKKYQHRVRISEGD
ncbi:MAG: hypothetical protein JWR83_1221 [Aeromicrobium sp.]|nr:hypothetical protein [Aeromicrobium sp.]